MIRITVSIGFCDQPPSGGLRFQRKKVDLHLKRAQISTYDYIIYGFFKKIK